MPDIFFSFSTEEISKYIKQKTKDILRNTKRRNNCLVKKKKETLLSFLNIISMVTNTNSKPISAESLKEEINSLNQLYKIALKKKTSFKIEIN